MLYISRFDSLSKGHNREPYYGVADTETGVETVHSATQIIKMITEDPSLEIAGVNTEIVSRGDVRKVTGIEIYQLPEYMSTAQAKLKLLYDVDIRVFDGDIRAIMGAPRRDVTIRLSSFGKTCNSYLFSSLVRQSIVTFVLDDRISIKKDSFYAYSPRGVIYDIREVTDENLLNMMYFGRFSSWHENMDYYRQCIIDDSARRDLYLGRFIVRSHLPKSMWSDKLCSQFTDFDSTVSKITDEYGGRFRRLVDNGVHTTRRKLKKEDIETLAKYRSFFMRIPDSGRSGINIYDKHHKKIESTLKLASDVDMSTFKMFCRYIKGLGGTNEFRVMFHQYILMIADWYLCKSNVWNRD